MLSPGQRNAAICNAIGMHTAMNCRLAISLLLALTASVAHAQVPLQWPATTRPEQPVESTVLPVLNRETGKFEAFLLVEPASAQSPNGLSLLSAPLSRSLIPGSPLLASDLQRPTRLRGNVRLEPGNNLAVLCDGPASLITSLGGLSQHCLLASLDQHPDPLARYSPALRAELSLDNGPIRVNLGIGAQRQGFSRAVLGAAPRGYAVLAGTSNNSVWWNRPLLNGYLSGLTLEQIDIGGQAYLPLGEQGWLAIGGSVARARLIANTNALFRSGNWTRNAITVGGGYGAFSGALTGHSTQSDNGLRWQGLDLGVSWLTPWSGRLSIGADNILSSGDSKVGLGEIGLPDEPKGRTPYVRYQQDL
ncbi:MAG: hypothetical protein COZ47_08090 [Lysobacterales bacterium CG_4_10_14_3_um_filter_64_11]|nr:MAG: hypothetical protein COZ47_08090 [Xanthomonadales bacterium CG_4_10_14_3_um_filter_64_11]